MEELSFVWIPSFPLSNSFSWKIYTYDSWWQSYTGTAGLNNAKSVSQTQELVWKSHKLPSCCPAVVLNKMMKHTAVWLYSKFLHAQMWELLSPLLLQGGCTNVSGSDKVCLQCWHGCQEGIVTKTTQPRECCLLKLSQHLASFFGFFLHMLLKMK